MARRWLPALVGALWALLLGVASSYEIKAVTPPVIMGESPYWDDATGTVIFIDVIGQMVLRYDPAHPEDLKNISLSGYTGRVTPAVPVKNCTMMLVGVGTVLHLVDVDWGAPGVPAVVKTSTAMSRVEEHLPTNRFNDGKADSRGRLWIGTMDDRQTSRRRRRRFSPNKGELFRFHMKRDLNQTSGYCVDTKCVVEDNLSIPNGMAWTPDDKYYYLADSASKAVYRFDFDAEQGVLSNRTAAFRFEDHGVPGAPDGLTLDVDGNLWIACVHGGRVIRVDPRTGSLLQTIRLNTTNPSAAEWGGKDRDVLYVTTARYQMGEQQLAREPDAGRTFAITGLGTRGLPSAPYPAVAAARADTSSASW
ncbi:hypothetical protein ONE63_000164 [Megalurothrips usitatus]|uniref:Regucalcin n=1 Tax=Megalurothrips usitatus TaxID=439358 RepID=A0AAV7Y1G1_9NEOP|nr:hypothetical protein ONE63_000164 [Megalurothrips usitatus]